jgi:orotidine-5'-phosphate decarboxylase
MMESFGARLHAAVARRGRLCVGIDPHAALLASWGLEDDVRGLERFSRMVAEALADRVAVFKPQSAFYERFGAKGIAVLESTIRQLHEAGALVLLDVKRGDIGSTAVAYGQAYLDPASPLWVDAITANPYLGPGALQPMIDLALAHGGGVFVLALTSNPEGRPVQHARLPDGRTVAQLVLDEVSQLNAGVEPLGSVGVVIGATVGVLGYDLSTVNGPILAPGLGAQGGRVADLPMVFGPQMSTVLPSYSREVLRRGPSPAGLRDAVAREQAACRAVFAEFDRA